MHARLLTTHSTVSGPENVRGARVVGYRRLLVALIAVLFSAALLISNPVGTQALTTPRAANTAGSAPIGSTAYAVPTGAVFVSPSGNDAGTGRATSPVRSVNRAVALAPDGGTIVLRAGIYHQSVSIQTKRVTIQNYPHEPVWLDGSSPVTGWVAQGAVWRKDGWTTRFDHSPTYTRGAPDSTSPNWAFINPAYPRAAYPDQVWIDGVPMRQVASLALVAAGRFYLDETTSRLYVGTNPVNHAVAATTIAKAISVQSTGTVLRGFGVMRYGPSVWHMGAITLERPNIIVENMVIADSATTGISAIAAGITMRATTVQRSGMLGIHASTADGLQLLSVASNSNNTERFNQAPVSGGFKIGKSRGILVKNGTFNYNYGPGGWFDCSAYDMKVVGNNFKGNAGHGMSFEISAKALFADNLVVGNTGFGVKVNNTSSVNVWNNTFVGNGRPINLVQDSRRASPVTTANRADHDLRQLLPDPTVTWLLGPVVVSNNVMGQQRSSGNCMLCVEDYSHLRTAAQMGIRSNGNVYNRPTGAPGWAVVWSRGSTNINPSVYTSLLQFSSATGQDRSRYAVDGIVVVSPTTGVPYAAVTSRQLTVAQVLPAAIAAATGRSATSRHLGAWL